MLNARDVVGNVRRVYMSVMVSVKNDGSPRPPSCNGGDDKRARLLLTSPSANTTRPMPHTVIVNPLWLRHIPTILFLLVNNYRGWIVF